ncbi:uncharacterized protein DUF4230 [Isoptericola jiangsuensis]|uniref:Uncharacterized protein DUF4230 n=1 Tax=Isoptericola jiangsuensis TaxID=548579 RepID=A0A2A9EVX5_9MICO|nr:DUF4230 domain-containing protein [Isoptericola jiangsuensis]PFG42432.1 uncharacterized protein DUF4230 [Isoptericola jiangsuensis]
MLALLLTPPLLLAAAWGADKTGLIDLGALANPFATEEVDRSETPVLLSVQNLARFVAAQGSYQVVLDLEQDTKYVPDWLMGERTIFVAEGSVDVYVDFRDLPQDAVLVAEDGAAVTISLPAPVLGEPTIDLTNSRALSETRGLINRAGDFFADDLDSRQETLLKAEEKLADVARESGLEGTAEENTRKTLEGLLRGLGYETVEVRFEADGR